MPERNSPKYYAMGLIDQLLLQGEDSRLYQALVQEKGYSSKVSGGINYEAGNMFDYRGPMLWTGTLVYDNQVASDSILAVVAQSINQLAAKGVDRATLDLALVKIRSRLYDEMGTLQGFGKANLLACFALFDDNPERINSLEVEFKKVTPALIQKTVREYLRPTNRTVIVVNPLAQQ